MSSQETSSVGSSDPKVSGVAMDRPAKRKSKLFRRTSMVALVVVASIVTTMLFIDTTGGRSLKIEVGQIVTSIVEEGEFDDYIPVRGRVTPSKTVYLDAVEGGRVERILVEDGTLLEAGDLIVELSNTGLQLDVTRNEALVMEQLNNVRTIELQLERNRLSHKSSIVDIDYQIQRLSREVKLMEVLVERQSISKEKLNKSKDELNYWVNRRNISKESQETDSRLQTAQLAFLKSSASHLKKNLSYSQKNLENLAVRAPLGGKLSGFNVEEGQSVERGGRLGQIDDPDHYKLVANIDEYYVGRIERGLTARYDRDGTSFLLTISKIYPEVKNGQFEVDLVFSEEQPTDIRRGQNIQTKLTLGDPTKALLIPNGSFFQDTGGNWVFVVENNGELATKRPVRLGRKNSRSIEVLDGLHVGDEVITSSYASYTGMDQLKLSAN